jgi:hypothetical protein
MDHGRRFSVVRPAVTGTWVHLTTDLLHVHGPQIFRVIRLSPVEGSNDLSIFNFTIRRPHTAASETPGADRGLLRQELKIIC